MKKSIRKRHQLRILFRNKTPIGVNAGGKITVKTSFIPHVRLADRRVAQRYSTISYTRNFFYHNVMTMKRPDSRLALNHCFLASNLSPK